MPNLSLSGADSSPTRVEAPIRVNGCRSRRIERAVGPTPTIRSSLKSSRAGYRTSSSVGESRWISSMKRTSRLSSLARSPAFSSVGPEVTLIPTPSSAAMMCARVVLPRPGGPDRSTWSSASPRVFVALMNTERLRLILGCPTYSARRLGRSDASNSLSSGGLSGVIWRSSIVLSQRARCRSASRSSRSSGISAGADRRTASIASRASEAA